MAINKIYLEKKNQERIKQMFYDNKDFPSIQLHDFFIPECYKQMKRETSKLKYKRSYLATSHSYSESNFNVVPKELMAFVSKIINKKVSKIKLKVLKFSWKDYVIINDKLKEKPGFDIILDITDDWNQDYGGSLVYVDGSGDHFHIPPKGNTLTIAERKKGVQKFVQYVNNLSKDKKRCLIVATVN